MMARCDGVLQQLLQLLNQHVHVGFRADERGQETQRMGAGGVQDEARFQAGGHHIGSRRRLMGEVDSRS